MFCSLYPFESNNPESLVSFAGRGGIHGQQKVLCTSCGLAGLVDEAEIRVILMLIWKT